MRSEEAVGAYQEPQFGELSRSRRRRLIEVDEDVAVANLDPKGLQREEAGGFDRLSGRHMKLAEVEAALDFLAVERPLGEVGGGVGAARLGGVERAVDVVDRHELVPDLAADDAVLR